MKDIDDHFGARKDVAYFRYVDDILILTNETDALATFKDVADRCKSIGLAVHDLGDGSKSEVGRLGEKFDYLGYQFEKQKVSVRGQSVQKLEATIAQLFTSYKYQLTKSSAADWPEKCTTALVRRLDFVIAGCIFENVPRGWIHYFSQMNDVTLLNRLDKYVQLMKNRFALPEGIRTKSFVRAHWHVLRPNEKSRTYIPNLDRFSEVDKEGLLSALFPAQRFDRLNPAELQKRFHAEVRRLVSMLERDISETS